MNSLWSITGFGGVETAGKGTAEHTADQQDRRFTWGRFDQQVKELFRETHLPIH